MLRIHEFSNVLLKDTLTVAIFLKILSMLYVLKSGITNRKKSLIYCMKQNIMRTNIISYSCRKA